MQKFNLLSGVSSAPGRVRTFREHPEYNTTPHSCALFCYNNDPVELVKFVTIALKGGAGVKIIFPASTNFDLGEIEPAEIRYTIDPTHPDAAKIDADNNFKVEYDDSDYASQVFDVTPLDTISGINGILSAIDEIYFYAGSRILVDLSNLRPAATINKWGMQSSGPSSFWDIFKSFHEFCQNPSIGSLLICLGHVNHTMRRGGYKKGIVTSAMEYDCPLVSEYLDVDITGLLGSHKLGLIIDPEVMLPRELVFKIVDKRNEQSLFLEKVTPTRNTWYNVCVAGDTWIQTSLGAKQVSELVGVQFDAAVNGQNYPSTPQGFWSNGVKPIIKLITKEGYSLDATSNHKIIKATRKGYYSSYQFEWVEIGSLKTGDKIQLNNNSNRPYWEGMGTHGKGWLLGQLLGNGSMVNMDNKNYARLSFFGDCRDELFNKAVDLIKSELGLAISSTNGRVYSIGTGEKSRHRTDDGRDYHVRSVTSKLVGDLANNYGMTKESKIATTEIEHASSDFYCGFLQGFFDADSYVSVGKFNGSGKSIQLSQSDASTIAVVQRMLARLGIKSTIYNTTKYQQPDIILRGCSVPSIRKESFRLDITGGNIEKYQSLIGFSKPDKIESLAKLIGSRKRAASTEQYLTTVLSVTPNGEAEVYDCTIDDVHCFDANGIIAHNCVGLEIGHRGTCLIWRVNLGLCRTAQEIVQGFIEATHELVKLHLTWRDSKSNPGIYANLEDDCQVGLDVMGLANYLSIQGITYLEFVEGLELYPKNYDWHRESKVYNLLDAIAKGYESAIETADKMMLDRGYPPLERMFTVEPAQSHSYETLDSAGYTTCRGIFAPFGRLTNRTSDSEINRVYNHGKVETASEIGADLQIRLCNGWQVLMNSTGRAHAISQDTYAPMTVASFMDWVDSPSRTLYYAEHNNYNQRRHLAKSIAVCTIDDENGCSSCAE